MKPRHIVFSIYYVHFYLDGDGADPPQYGQVDPDPDPQPPVGQLRRPDLHGRPRGRREPDQSHQYQYHAYILHNISPFRYIMLVFYLVYISTIGARITPISTWILPWSTSVKPGVTSIPNHQLGSTVDQVSVVAPLSSLNLINSININVYST